MNISELLSHSSLELLPKQRSEQDYESYIKSLFDSYLGLVDEAVPDDWPTGELKRHHDVLECLCDRIRSALGEYLSGFPARAYKSLGVALQKVLCWLRKLGSTEDVSRYFNYLYRVRVGNLTDYRRSDLFHIPFEKRHIVSPQRYSILGLPSLYLGGSVWVCWEELNRPAFERIQVSRFMAAPDSKVRVLDFAYRPAVMAELARLLKQDLQENAPNANFVLAHAVCWPLLAACSIRVEHPGSPFIPEYIIPQLLLQWIRDKDLFEGIRYFSTRIPLHVGESDSNQIQNAASAAANYVFPAVRKSPVGHCEQLTSQFKLTAPMAWPIIQNIQMIEKDPQLGPPDWVLSLHGSLQVKYLNTSFYKCERKINALPCKSVFED